MVSLSTTSLTSSVDANFLHQSLAGRGPPSSLHWRNSGVGNGRERLYTYWSSGCYVHPGWSSDVFGYRYGGMFKNRPSLPIPCNPEVRSTFCERHALPGANVFGHFLFVYFLFLIAPFMLARTVHFYGPAFDLPSTFFYFCNTCLFVTFRISSGVACPNIILLHSGMASKSIRYSITHN